MNPPFWRFFSPFHRVGRLGRLLGLAAGLLLCGSLPLAQARPLAPYGIFNVHDTTYIDGIAISPDDKTVAFTGPGRGEGSPRLFLFNASNGKKLTAPKESESGMGMVEFAPDGKTMVCVGRQNLWIWKVGSWKVLHKQFRGCVTRLAYSPDSKLLAMTESNRTVGLWEVSSGKLVVALPFFANDKGSGRVAFAPDGKTLAVGDWWGFVELWDLSGPVPLKNLDTQKPRLTLDCEEKGLCFVGFTPDSKSVVTVAGTKARVWDAKTGALTKRHHIVRPKTPVGGGPYYYTAALSPNGKTLALNGLDCFVALWDLDTGKVWAKLGEKLGMMTQVAFAKNGTFLIAATGGAQGAHGYLFKIPKKK